MSDAADAPLTWKQLPVHFAVYMFIGTAMFILIAGIAVFLGYVVHWTEPHFPKEAVLAIKILKWAIFAGDLVVYVVYLGRTLWHHLVLTTTVAVQ